MSLKKNSSEVRRQALELYQSGMGLVEISRALEIPEGTVRSWKNRYKWERATDNATTTATTGKKSSATKKGATKKKKSGGQPGNKNAVGHGGTTGNQNASKHGLFAKYADSETLEIMDSMQTKQPLDLMWDGIMVQYSAIVRSMKIMHVKDINDKTIEKTGHSESDMGYSDTWDIQQAWDKQANYLKSLARAIDSLRCGIKDYLELEGQSKADAKANAEDWKTAIIEIARRRSEQNNE